MSITLTVLIDNTRHIPSCATQHGLSCWLDTGSTRLLIDAGQDAAFLANAGSLEIPAAEAEWLVLTHGHYDHTGGVPALLAAGARPRIAVHPLAWVPRRSRRDGQPPREIGIPWPASLPAQHGIACVSAGHPHRLAPGIWSTGSIPNCTGLRPSPSLQRAGADGWEPDTFPDEHAVVVHTTWGLVVVTGCCHTGLMNTLLAAQSVTGISTIFAVIGGLHLHDAAPETVAEQADHLRRMNVQRLLVNHCTGDAACAILRERLGSRVEWAGAGCAIELPPLVAERGDG